MSREVKINSIPKEEKETFLDNMLTKIIIGFLIIVIGHGLVIWKNQDAFDTKLTKIEEDIKTVIDAEHRVIKLEQYKENAYNRLDILEQESHIMNTDRNQRGGSFRRDDADKLRITLETQINKNSGKIAALEWKVDNLNSRLFEMSQSVKESIKESYANVRALESNINIEHTSIRKEIMENSAEDNIRHATVQDRQKTMSDALVSLNNELESSRDRIDKKIKSCEDYSREKIGDFND